MKILLVYPKSEYGIGSGKKKKVWAASYFGYPSITIPHIAAITPREHSVEILDENYEDVDFEKEVDLVGISCLTETALHVYELSDEFRKRGKKVVIGGYHASALPKEAKKHADSVVIGEAELSWPQVIKDISQGKEKPFYPSNKEFDMSIIPHIRRDLIKHQTLFGAVQSTRGCVNRCEFCSIISFYRHGVKHRQVEDVIEEIETMPNDFFIFHDPSLTTNPKYTRKLFKLLIEKKIRKSWSASGNANVLATIDEDFLKLAKKSGCIQWNIGFESVSQASLNGVRKTCNKVEEFEKIVKRIHKYGMLIQCGIIFGFDQDTVDVFDATLEKLHELQIDIVQVNILTPFPGTPLFDRLEKEKRILTRDWSKYNLTTVVFKPKNMTEKELFEGARKVAKEFYSLPNVIIRTAKILMTSKRIAGAVPASSNFSHRGYYARDFSF